MNASKPFVTGRAMDRLVGICPSLVAAVGLGASTAGAASASRSCGVIPDPTPTKVIAGKHTRCSSRGRRPTAFQWGQYGRMSRSPWNLVTAIP